MSGLRVAFVGPERPPRAWSDALKAEPQLEIVSPDAAGCALGIVWVGQSAAEVQEWVEELMRRPPYPLVLASAGPAPGGEREWTRRGVVLTLSEHEAEPLPLLRLAAEIVPVVHPRQGTRGVARPTSSVRVPVAGLAASAGGPKALAELLGALPASTPGCLLVVQHMAPDFVGGLQRVLQRATSLEVEVAGEGARVRRGVVFVAPAERHLALGPRGRLELREPEALAGHVPSADVLLASIASTCGARGTALVLSGMGEDGAAGAAALGGVGGTVYCQATETCVIAGMPEAAQRAARVQATGAPHELGALLARRFQTLSEQP